MQSKAFDFKFYNFIEETEANQNSLEDVIIKTINAYQNQDEKTLNELILKDFGLAFLYRRGGGSSISHPTINGKEYVTVQESLIESIDFATLRVLSEEMLADKNAIYYQTEVITFDKLEGF